jgi:1,2-diacylglycerol 3-alpha-glucosyltransferase/glucuronosyltransferase
MRILLITDAWHPQVNGVVRTLDALKLELERTGHSVETITPDQFHSFPMPGYPEIRLALVLSGPVRERILRFDPHMIHIATEGPLGCAGRSACLKLGLPFTTSYHTRFPEYLRSRAPVPVNWTYAWLRRFHSPARACLVATQSIAADLRSRGFSNIVVWTRGVDRGLFRPMPGDTLASDMGWKRPIFLNVGRVSVEKNLEAFLGLDLPGTKLVVGDGPARVSLERRFADCVFVGNKTGTELARHYAAADVFVFPSRTDTFGNVLLEALASGVPVAAYPVPGPLDVVGGTAAGVLDEDLRKAAIAALDLPKSAALELAKKFTWKECASIFLAVAAPVSADLT